MISPSLIPQILTMYRRTTVQGLTGAENAPTYQPDVDAWEVPGSIQPANARTQIDYAQRNMRVTHSLYFDWDWSPRILDQWRDVDTGKVFIVQGWYESIEINDSWTCDCEQQTPYPML